MQHHEYVDMYMYFSSIPIVLAKSDVCLSSILLKNKPKSSLADRMSSFKSAETILRLFKSFTNSDLMLEYLLLFADLEPELIILESCLSPFCLTDIPHDLL